MTQELRNQLEEIGSSVSENSKERMSDVIIEYDDVTPAKILVRSMMLMDVWDRTQSLNISEKACMTQTVWQNTVVFSECILFEEFK